MNHYVILTTVSFKYSSVVRSHFVSPRNTINTFIVEFEELQAKLTLGGAVGYERHARNL